MSNCCYPKNSQLNGNNGEATNTDDLKNRSRVDSVQNKRIANLERKLANLPKQKKEGKKKKNNGRKSSSQGKSNKPHYRNNPFPGISTVTDMDAQPAIVHRDPTVVSAVAQLAPFRIPRGVANILTACKPTQKFTARALMTISALANIEYVVIPTPSIASDTNNKSVMVLAGSRANLGNQTLVATTLASGVANFDTVSNTPYPSATLAGNDFQWRLVSSGIRVRNTTSAVNRQGVIKWIVDHEHNLINYSDDNATYKTIADSLDASHRTVRRNMASQPESDVVLSGQLYPGNVTWWSAEVVDTDAFWPVGTAAVRAIGSSKFRLGPAVILLPSVGTPQTYDFEIIEHWEIHGTSIETLHTPSGSHDMCANTLSAIVKQAHHQHSMTPSMALHDVVKGISFAEHHKAAIKDAVSVAAAIAIL